MRTLAVALLAAALLLPMTSQAQDATAPHLSPAAKVLYAHHHDSDTAELNGWMNTLVTDPTGNDIALGPSTSVPGAPAGNFAGTRTHTLTLNPALQGTVKLDPAGNIVINAYIGSGSGNGVVRVSTEIKYGAEVVATGAAVNHPYQAAGTGPYGKVSWTVAPAITEFAPGKDLVWTVTLTGVAQAAFLSVSAERGSSGIEFPVLSSSVSGSTEGAAQRHELTGDAPSFNLSAPTPMNATHVYTWTGPATPMKLVLSGDRQAGNATLLARDAANKTMANVTFSGPATHDLSGAAGNWSITVTLAGFRGNLTAEIEAPSSSTTSGSGTGGPGSTSSGSKTGTRSGTATNGTGNETDDGGDGKGTPAPALPALLGAMAVAVAWARRRR